MPRNTHCILLACCVALLATLTSVPIAAAAAGDEGVWHFKREMLPQLVKQVPKLLKSQDRKTGRFGEGVWIVNDQNAIYPLAVAWAAADNRNPYYHSPEVLDAIMLGGDALIAAQDPRGMWVFRKEDMTGPGCIGNEVNGALDTLRKKGVIKALQLKWFGHEMPLPDYASWKSVE